MERPEIKNDKLSQVVANIEKVIVGKREAIELLLTAVLAGGHILIEDVPGVGKTQLVACVSHSLNGKFNRLQLTPDVMPSDITGFSMINPLTKETEFRQGAAFCNFLLADEINRSSPKTQSALLEIMEEGQLSVDGITYKLPRPFMVLATQNPVETYGTYHLPEAQMDRFLMKISMGYPEKSDELRILRRDADAVPSNLDAVISTDEVETLKKEVLLVTCSPRIEEYIVNIAEASRNSDYIRLGISPRGSLALHKCARAYALLCGRNFVLPDDVKYLAPFVLSHRIILSPKGKSVMGTCEKALQEIINTMDVPIA